MALTPKNYRIMSIFSAGIPHHPGEQWIPRNARNATRSGCLSKFLFLCFHASLAFQAPWCPPSLNSFSPFSKHVQCQGHGIPLSRVPSLSNCPTIVGLESPQPGLKLQRGETILINLYWNFPVTFFIVVINLCLYIGLLQFCGVFFFFFFSSFFNSNF